MTQFLTRAFSAAVLAGGLAVAPVAAVAQDFRIGLITPPGHGWTVHAEQFGQLLAERSGGRMTVTVFPAGQLGDEATMVQQLQTGALDFGFLTAAEVSNRIPEFGALFTPFLVADATEAAALLRGPTAQEMLELLPDELGMIGVGFGQNDMRHMLFLNPISSAAEMSGLRMRITPLRASRDFYNFLGVAPTPMPLTDVFDALANGLVDAIDLDLMLILQLRLQERARQMMITNHQMWPMLGLISGRVYARMSPADRALVTETMEEALENLLNFVADGEPGSYEQMRATGIQMTEVGPEFFGDILERWEALWTDQAELIADLRAEVAAIRGN